MKKILAGTFATLMMGSGLVVATNTSAEAAPYPGTVTTRTKVSHPDQINRGQRLRVCVKVRAVNSDTNPKGQVTVRVVHGKKTYRWVGTEAYRGSRICMKSKRLKRIGNYTVIARFEAKPDSIWKDSDHTSSARVTRRR